MCEKVLWLLHISLEKWPARKKEKKIRLECSLSLFSSIRLSAGGKHRAHPPVDYSSDTAKPPPYSHVQAVLKHMCSL